MANENWEEINEWDIEEDIDLAQRITVHSVHSIDNEEEFQFIQAHKNPTYAAAAKWGERKSSSSNNDKANITNKNSSEKKSSSTSPKGVTKDDDKEKKSSSASPKGMTKDDDKEKKSSASSKNVKNDDKSENDILKGDHDVDYETSVPKKETRRNNTKLHKIHSQKLMSSLISDAELESNQDLVKGDTNRDPEFKKYKLLKKTMALNKKYAEKSKSDRKNLERVEVW